MRVVQETARVLPDALFAVHDGSGRHEAFVERVGDHERLHDGAGLQRELGQPVRGGFGGHGAAVVRVEGGTLRRGEDVAVRRIDKDRPGGMRFHAFAHEIELLLHDGLQGFADGEEDVVAVERGFALAVDVGHGPSVSGAFVDHGAGRGGHGVVEGAFDALDRDEGVVGDVREAENVREHRVFRVFSAVGAGEGDPVEGEFLNLFLELPRGLVFHAGRDDGVVAVLFLLFPVRGRGRDRTAAQAAEDLVGLDVLAVLFEEIRDHAAFGLGLVLVLFVQDVDVRRIADDVHRRQIADEKRPAEVVDLAARAVRLDPGRIGVLRFFEEFVVTRNLHGIEHACDVAEPADEQDVHESHADGHGAEQCHVGRPFFCVRVFSLS